jgi:hypothetical protein
MNRKDAKIIAETITNVDLALMFKLAKENIKDWTKVSSINKGLTKGTTWNILASNFDINHNYNTLVKVNMIREFGEFLPEYLKPKKVTKKINNTPLHQEPKF